MVRSLPFRLVLGLTYHSGAGIAKNLLLVRHLDMTSNRMLTSIISVWKELGSKMKGIVNIAQVDCEAHGAVCRAENIEGYPTLALYVVSSYEKYYAALTNPSYNQGKHIAYHGGRTLDAMEAWATKAVASAGWGLRNRSINTSSLTNSSQRNAMDQIGRYGGDNFERARCVLVPPHPRYSQDGSSA